MSRPGNPLVEIARDMRRLPEETRKAIRPALRKAGEMIAHEAKVNASWSSRIPSSIRVETSFRQNREGVIVRAGNANSPHARPYEGLTSSGSTFRHPVFGRDVWVAQTERPFLFPAAEAGQAAATEAVASALDDVGQSLGFS